ncbi:MAG TPA: type II toxin-antitoxin system death-on-curing family toxin [Candidatus Acidoferrum sp.]|jgi:death-on-curing protein
MIEPRWIQLQTVTSLQSEAIAEHGGLRGIRDQGALLSAMSRAQNRFAYEADTDVAQLAAAYGFGLARNHPFTDGNKRIAFIAMTLFLGLNGHSLSSTRIDEIETMLKLAAGELAEDELAAWIRAHIEPRG